MSTLAACMSMDRSHGSLFQAWGGVRGGVAGSGAQQPISARGGRAAVVFAAPGSDLDAAAALMASNPTTGSKALDAELRRGRDPVRLIAAAHAAFCGGARDGMGLHPSLGESERLLALLHALRNVESRLAEAMGWRMGARHGSNRRARRAHVAASGGGQRGAERVSAQDDVALPRRAAWWRADADAGPPSLTRAADPAVVGGAPAELLGLVRRLAASLGSSRPAAAALPSSVRLAAAASLGRLLRRGALPPGDPAPAAAIERLLADPGVPLHSALPAATSSAPSLASSSPASWLADVAAGHGLHAAELPGDLQAFVEGAMPLRRPPRRRGQPASVPGPDADAAASLLADHPSSRAAVATAAGAASGADAVVLLVPGSALDAADSLGLLTALAQGLAAARSADPASASRLGLRLLRLEAAARHRDGAPAGRAAHRAAAAVHRPETPAAAAVSLAVAARAVSTVLLRAALGRHAADPRRWMSPAAGTPALCRDADADAVGRAADVLEALNARAAASAGFLRAADLADLASSAAAHAVVTSALRSGCRRRAGAAVGALEPVVAELGRILTDGRSTAQLRAALAGTMPAPADAQGTRAAHADAAGAGDDAPARLAEQRALLAETMMTSSVVAAACRAADAARTDDGALSERGLALLAAAAALEPHAVALLAALPATSAPGAACSAPSARAAALAARAFAHLERLGASAPSSPEGAGRLTVHHGGAGALLDAAAAVAAVEHGDVDVVAAIAGLAARTAEAGDDHHSPRHAGSVALDVALARVLGSAAVSAPPASPGPAPARSVTVSAGAWATAGDTAEALSAAWATASARNPGAAAALLGDAASLAAAGGATARAAASRLRASAGGVPWADVLAASTGPRVLASGGLGRGAAAAGPRPLTHLGRAGAAPAGRTPAGSLLALLALCGGGDGGGLAGSIVRQECARALGVRPDDVAGGEAAEAAAAGLDDVAGGEAAEAAAAGLDDVAGGEAAAALSDTDDAVDVLMGAAAVEDSSSDEESDSDAGPDPVAGPALAAPAAEPRPETAAAEPPLRAAPPDDVTLAAAAFPSSPDDVTLAAAAFASSPDDVTLAAAAFPSSPLAGLPWPRPAPPALAADPADAAAEPGVPSGSHRRFATPGVRRLSRRSRFEDDEPVRRCAVASLTGSHSFLGPPPPTGAAPPSARPAPDDVIERLELPFGYESPASGRFRESRRGMERATSLSSAVAMPPLAMGGPRLLHPDAPQARPGRTGARYLRYLEQLAEGARA